MLYLGIYLVESAEYFHRFSNCSWFFTLFVFTIDPVVRKTFRNFKGYTNIPFEAVLCSDVCANVLYIQWLMTADAEKSDFDNEDNPAVDNRNPLKIVHLRGNYYAPEYSCRDRISNFLRRALCCC